MTQVNCETVISGYVKLRDARSALKAAYEEEDEKLKAKMEKLETWLLQKMNQDGATQLGAEAGTAYKQTKIKASCSDWPTTWEFMAENRRFDMVEKRLSVTAVKEYFEETGNYPPGVNVHTEMAVVVRRG